ncbi:MAG: SCO family protein [Methylophilaceae bacterium]
MQSSPTQNSSGRKTLLILAVVFLMPFTLAATLHLVGWKASARSYGELVNPPQSLQLPDLSDAQGQPFSAKQWEKKWTMVMVASACEAACQAQLQTLQNLRTSLAKDTERLQLILLLTADSKILPPQKVTVLMGADVADFSSQFKVAGQPTPQAGRVYLVDPLGNLMMSYASGFEPKGVRHDLTRLLKNSWAG